MVRADLLDLLIRKAFAAWVYRSAAFSHFSCRPPKRLNPLPAPETALSAWGWELTSYRGIGWWGKMVPFGAGRVDLVP